MTAPNTQVAPSDSHADAVEDALSAALAGSLQEQGVPEAEIQRDANGRFVPRHSSEDFTTEDTPAEPAAALPADAKTTDTTAADPEGPVVLEAADPATLATHFTLKDATGGELAIPKGLVIEFRANGKSRAEPLDKVVKFAEMGFYNHEREQRMQTIASENVEYKTEVAATQQQLATREAQLEQLLSDPAYLERALSEYQKATTPEAQAQRLLERANEEREQVAIERERDQIDAVGKPYYEREIVPSLEMIRTAAPYVTEEEIVSKLTRFTDTLIDPRTKRIPPAKHAQINQYFLTEMIPWATQLHEFRGGGRTSQQPKVDTTPAVPAAKPTKEIEDLQLRAQRAKRSASANLRPPGRIGTPNAPASKITTKSTHAERMDDVIGSTLAAVGLGGNG